MIKVAGLKAWNSIKKKLFKVYLINTYGWLLLQIPPFQTRFHHTFMITLFFVFLFMFFYLLLTLLVKGSQPPFLRHHP